MHGLASERVNPIKAAQEAEKESKNFQLSFVCVFATCIQYYNLDLVDGN